MPGFVAGDAEALARAVEASLLGPDAPASPESWAAFDTAHAASRYEQVLLDG